MLHQSGLYIHMISLLIVGGGSFGSIIIEKQMWLKAIQGSPDALVLLPPLSMAKNFVMSGVVLFLISGLILLGSVHFAFITQGWFIAKFTLFLFLPARGALVAKPIMKQVGIQLQNGGQDKTVLLSLKKRLNRFHVIQYAIVAVILFLVIFKI